MGLSDLPTDRRTLCRSLLDRMPESGLDEAVESLARIVEFWRENDAHVPSPRPDPPRSVRARITGTYTAPVYPIPED